MKRIETVNGKHMKIADKLLHIEPTTAEIYRRNNGYGGVRLNISP